MSSSSCSIAEADATEVWVVPVVVVEYVGGADVRELELG